jgi:GDP-L-fucose synthase
MFKSKMLPLLVARDVRAWFRNTDPSIYDLVIHCAAIVGGRLKIDGDPLAVATDLSIDAEMFNWIVRTDRKPKLVYFSSSAVYPLELQRKSCHCNLAEPLVNFDTSRIAMPDQTYGWSKLCGEYLAKHAAEKYGLDVAIYRPFGGYGEDQSLDYPWPSIMKRVLDGEDPVTVWGSGDQRRDLIHIDDIVSAVLQTMGRLRFGEVLNLGTGRGLSFREIARIAADQLGIRCNIVNDASKPEGVFARVADTTKLDALYCPTITVEDGIRRFAAAFPRLTPAA